MTSPPSPAELFGPLFAAVQERGLFADSKTFADAVPRIPPSAILLDWREAGSLDDAGLRDFVTSRFDLPGAAPEPAPDGLPLERHIATLWSSLTRASEPAPGSSELALPRPFVVPGGRFRELYYWDSYFTMLGLARSGRQDLVEDMIANFGSMLERFGRIPNGSRTYYLTRSQPPVFYLMAGLSAETAEASRRQRLSWMRMEHDFWMDGADGLEAGHQARRVVRFSDGALMNRYWDDSDRPRDESWREDVALAIATPERPSTELWREIRAGAESGWDFSSRWLADGATLATIRTTRIVPIDLNCLLFGLERAISREGAALGDQAVAERFDRLAERRRRTIEKHMWDETHGYYCDASVDDGATTGALTAASAFALFTGLADSARAARVAEAIIALLRPGGLATTSRVTGEQWDAPNGWGPLQWIAVSGLQRYGHRGLARVIAARWLTMVEDRYRATGQLHEKYDVACLEVGKGGEYVPETGFGWTNGVTLELMAMLADESGKSNELEREKA